LFDDLRRDLGHRCDPCATTRWRLSPDETDALAETLRGYGAKISEVSIGRGYEKTAVWVKFDISPPALDRAEVETILRRLEPVFTARITALEDDTQKKPPTLLGGI
jgi:hypothetical protein